MVPPIVLARLLLEKRDHAEKSALETRQSSNSYTGPRIENILGGTEVAKRFGLKVSPTKPY